MTKLDYRLGPAPYLLEMSGSSHSIHGTDNRNRSRVLVVDDDAPIRSVLERALLRDGHEVYTASNTLEAMAVVREQEIHLILCDINMPGSDGIELLRRALAHDPDIEVVMATAVTDTEVAFGALGDGASEYLAKPFRMSEVRRVVGRCLERRRMLLESRARQEGRDPAP